MLKIRLSRFGTKNRPTYRLTITEHTKDALGDILEYLGSYNPRSNPKFIQLKEERIKYWLSQGAQASPTVHNLLVSQGVIEDKKVKAWQPKKKKAKKEEGKKEGEAPKEGKKPAAGEAKAKTPVEGGEEKPASPDASQGGKDEPIKKEVKEEKSEEKKEEVKEEPRAEEKLVEDKKPVEEEKKE